MDWIRGMWKYLAGGLFGAAGAFLLGYSRGKKREQLNQASDAIDRATERNKIDARVDRIPDDRLDRKLQDYTKE